MRNNLKPPFLESTHPQSRNKRKKIYPYMSSSSSPPPCGLLESAEGSDGADSVGAAAVSAGADSAVAAGVAESLLAVAAGAGAGAAGAGAGVGAGAWNAGMLPPMSLRRKFAACSSFLSHAK